MPTYSQTINLKLIQAEVKHLIFDLGGVIINLNTKLTIQAFSEITGKSIDETMDFAHSHPIFPAYEKGEVDSAEFRSVIRSLSHHPLADEAIDLAWNAMILDLPTDRTDLLETLKGTYDIFLLSNTNHIHMDKVNQVRVDSGVRPFDLLFQKDYYSHLMGKRKPDTEIFDQVLSENNLNPTETVFFDDNVDNIKGAAQLGIQTVHVTSPQVMMDYFNGQ
mgnify:FL=1